MWSAAPAPRRPVGGLLRPGFALARGMKVGVFGGSFNPAHPGHAHVAETARERLALDRVLWLVSPQNPLKSAQGTASLAERLAGARRLARGRAMIVSDVETRAGTRYTIDTLRALKARFPGVRFVWLMGADGLRDLHLWRGWPQILREIPVAAIARPGASLKSRQAPAARRFAHARRPARQARLLAGGPTPGWAFLCAPWNFQSSTALRAHPKHDRLTPG